MVEGDPGDAREPGRGSWLVADALAEHLEISLGCGLPAALRRGWNTYPTHRLWPPEAHDPRLDLRRRRRRAQEWMELPGGGGRRTAGAGALDWSGKHFRFAENRLRTVYDWDSVRVATEAVVVGDAAFSFTANWDLPEVDPAPDPGEVSAFIGDYDAARASRLTTSERAQVVACGAYLMAHVARCEHANGDPDGSYTRALRAARQPLSARLMPYGPSFLVAALWHRQRGRDRLRRG